MSAARYALYYAPEAEEALAAWGAGWLGRDAATGAALAQPAVPGLTPEALADLTAEPRRYGLHGTLKPPFRLAEGRSEGELVAAAAALAAATSAFVAPPPRLAAIGRFLALIPSAPAPALHAAADACVRGLDAFRAPPPAAELARRRGAGLTAGQEAMLARWGYPYVLDEFRFHLTLTRRLDAAEHAVLFPWLEEATRPFCQAPMRVRSLCLFVEPAGGGPFTILRRLPLQGG